MTETQTPTLPSKQEHKDAVEADFESIFTQDFNDWGPEVVLWQPEVDDYVRAFKDTNVIHTAREGIPTVVPGLMVASCLPRLLVGDMPLQTPDRTLMNLGFDIDFMRPVFVGLPMRMRYKPRNLRFELRGPVVTFDFEIGVPVKERMKTAASGAIRILVLYNH